MHTYTIYERGHNHGTNKKEAGGAEPRGGEAMLPNRYGKGKHLI